MANFEKMFEDFFDSVNKSPTSIAVAKSISMESMDSRTVSESFNSLPYGPQEEFLLQTQIRPIFGKDGVNSSPIGTHPDFLGLEETGTTQKHYTPRIAIHSCQCKEMSHHTSDPVELRLSKLSPIG